MCLKSPPAENDLFNRSSKYYSDDAQNITVMIKILLLIVKILLWCSKYYSGAPDITSTNWRYQEVGKRALMMTQEVGEKRK
jgi:hypothetical protein